MNTWSGEPSCAHDLYAHTPGPGEFARWRERYLPDLIGEAPTLQRAISEIRSVADADCPVTIRGESGTGKELAARGIHEASRRAGGPMLSINCGALAESVVESELFGHARGAFTGADRDRAGLFVAAHGGTLFLDEVAELPLLVQAKLLRVLQEGEVRPVGANQPTAIDVRIVTATHVDLEVAVAEGRFREDLYYRLNVIPVDLPPLRERACDIEALVAKFLRRFNRRLGLDVTGATPKFIERLAEHDWPGNIRELENLINRLVVLKRRGELEVHDLPFDFGLRTIRGPQRISDPSSGTPVDLPAAVRDLERDLIDRALSFSNGNKAVAARMLNVRRTTLIAKIRRLDETDEDTVAPRRRMLSVPAPVV